MSVTREALMAQLQEDEVEAGTLGMPSYLVAADNHSVANNNQSFIEGAIETATNIPTYLAASVVSGLNQIYNIVPTIGNYAGGDFELSKTGDVIQALDADLGKYYEEHAESVDVGGFLLSSLVPGMAGIKALNMGQKALATANMTGRVGKNLQAGFGFASTTRRQQYLDKAVKEVSNTNSLSLITNTNTMKAMAAGYGSAVLDMAAFETATAIALSASPVLEHQDLGDITTNIAVFGGIFGTIGGGISVVRSAFKVKGAKAEADLATTGFNQVLQLHEAAPPANKVAFSLQQVNKIIDTPPQLVDDLVAQGNVTRETIEASVEGQKAFYDNQIRKNLTILAGNDKDLGAAAYMMMTGKGSKEAWKDYLGAQKFSRRTDFTAEEKLLNQITKRIQAGKGLTTDADELLKSTVETSYVNIWGEAATMGRGTTEVPIYTSLSDTLKVGESIKIGKSGITVGKTRYDFNTDSIKADRPNMRIAGFDDSLKRETAGSHYDVTKNSTLNNEARHIWALQQKPFVSASDLKAKLKDPKRPIGVLIDENDIPLLEKMYREFHIDHKVKLESGERLGFTSQEELYKFILEQKDLVARKMLKRTIADKKIGDVPLTHEEIAASVNVTPGWLNAEIRSVDYDRSVFALQGYAADYAERQVGLGVNQIAGKTKTAEELLKEAPVYLQPKTLKVTTDTAAFRDMNGMLLEGMGIIQQQERLLSQRVQNVTANYFGDDFNKLIPISKDVMLDAEQLGIIGLANSLGAGSKFLTAASANYGSLANHMEAIGRFTSIIKGKKVDAMNEVLNPSLVGIAGSQKAAIEWSTLHAKIRSYGGQKYVLSPKGNFLERKEIALHRRQAAEGVEGISLDPPPTKFEGAPDVIPMRHPQTIELARTHVLANGKRVHATNEMRTAQGMEIRVEADEFYPIPINPKDVPFFAIVTDDSITGTGHSSMIYANSEAELETMISKLGVRTPVRPGSNIFQADNWKIYTKKDAEDYFKSFGTFEKGRALNDNYVDTAMARKGISSPMFVATDPVKVVQDTHAWHSTQETSLVREMLDANYEKEFEYLRQRGREFTNLSTSKFNSTASLKHAENVVRNPYMDYIRTAMDVKNYADYPFWVNANIQLEKKVSDMYDRITATFYKSKSVEELSAINTELAKSGYKGAAYDAKMEFIVNHTAPKSALQNFVQKSNAILATTILRLDMMNAITNAVSSNILYGAEMKSIQRAINRDGGEKAVGALAALRDVKVPGTGESIISPQKIMANAYKAFGRDNAEMKFFKDHGFVTTISDQYKSVIDNMTLNGTESALELSTKLSKAREIVLKGVDKGERWTGNRLAEEFNRFISAHSMKQITDIAVAHGAMDSRSALAYINTFVNRTQGNYLASQRPMIFQGAVGQSIGLFQTYQFNLMQQLLRHVGEGTAKDTATLIGLQGTIFGLNGLPAFNAINTHIIGTASGNNEHKDAYTTIYGAAGKDAGDWLMYGLASNMLLHPDLKTNLYVRGDINPRNITVVPVNPANIPIVQAAGKFFGNIWDASRKVAGGGDIPTAILQGLEHNGISRPLAGIAQTLQGLANPENATYSTSKRGNVIGSNDMLSLVNMGRMMGGKPLGEAVATDKAYRIKSYALSDSRKRNNLGETIKSTIIAGQQPSRDQVEDFAFQYAALGGKSEEFHSWMMQLYTTANTSQANELRRSLNSPFSKNMQLIMGGYELNDFTN